MQQPQDTELPKCLLRFGGRSLLERHLQLLRGAGVEEVVLALGFSHQQVEAELDSLRWQPRPEIVLNPGFELGSVLTVHTVAAAMTRVSRAAIVVRKAGGRRPVISQSCCRASRSPNTAADLPLQPPRPCLRWR